MHTLIFATPTPLGTRMSTAIRAIETTYAGCRFRSRLEARWAVVFDHFGIPWQYEPGGYEVCEGWHDVCWGCPDPDCHHVDQEAHTASCGMARYLPDFHLGGDVDLWVEVKGWWTADDLRKVVLASIDARGGLPLRPDGPAPDDRERNRRRVLLLGDIPRRHAWHYVTRFNKGSVYLEHFFWGERGPYNHLPTTHLRPALAATLLMGEDLWNDADGFCDLEAAAAVLNQQSTIAINWPESHMCSFREPAYEAGRAARFEHGAQG